MGLGNKGSGKRTPVHKNEESEAEIMERMNEALKRALSTPPRHHKDEPKHRPKKGKQR